MTDDRAVRDSLVEAARTGEFPGVSELRERVAHGDQGALILLGHLYFRGVGGVRKDYGEALYWFRKFKLEYDVTGLVAAHLAKIHYLGLGVPRSRRMAAWYLRSAALRGHGRSRIAFAMLQKKGDGTLMKPRAANTLLRASACDPRLSVMMRLAAFLYFLG
jgi:hypothetical protein